MLEFRMLTSQGDEALSYNQVTFSRSWFTWYRRSLIVRDHLWLLWTILAVELSLAWSSLADIYSVSTTGQLIPLIIGIASLFPILTEASEALLKEVSFPTSDVEHLTKYLQSKVQTDHWAG
jgi:hypothetical protein